MQTMLEESRRSTTGYVILYEGSPVSWCTRKQPIVSLSTTEAEYIAAADCVKETLYLKNFLQEITDKDVKVNLNIDNQSTMQTLIDAVNILKLDIIFCVKVLKMKISI